MRKFKKVIMLQLAAVLLAACSGKAEEGVFVRIERDDPNAWKEELANVRFLQEEKMSGRAHSPKPSSGIWQSVCGTRRKTYGS